jgi:hypothetical protein
MSPPCFWAGEGSLQLYFALASLRRTAGVLRLAQHDSTRARHVSPNPAGIEFPNRWTGSHAGTFSGAHRAEAEGKASQIVQKLGDRTALFILFWNDASVLAMDTVL